ncbi:hypothetical protein AJ80_04713 [Polytolypa hystricis UAMH7299]|uniref:AT hook motif protein n=1 Tax=Polytolypa hystricis (strain UAMH7299) TaxID=1447883 RepID=A0A2B7Y8Y2_POLH7|nr:hypothetical protein AJ80_04713 [Polytolypa hystricis UAMH7299]
MPITWNDATDAKILVGILKTAKPKIDFDALAQYVGDGCTAYAVQHRIRKIQAKASLLGSGTTGTGTGSDAPNTPPTPAKRSKAATKKKNPAEEGAKVTKRKPVATGHGKKKAMFAAKVEESDGDEMVKGEEMESIERDEGVEEDDCA